MPGIGSSDVAVYEDRLDLGVFFEGLSGARNKARGLSGWLWLWELMMVSQIMACEGGIENEELLEGHVARMYTNTCLVFQLKSEEKSKKSIDKRDEKAYRSRIANPRLNQT